LAIIPGMTMPVISNEVRDLSLIPFSKEHMKVTKDSDVSDMGWSRDGEASIPSEYEASKKDFSLRSNDNSLPLRPLRPFDVTQDMLCARYSNIFLGSCPRRGGLKRYLVANADRTVAQNRRL
jgi:hypothetical protein